MTRRILFLCKHIDTQERRIWSQPRAVLQMYAQWLRLATAAHHHPRHLNKVLGVIQWHVRPSKGMSPFLAGAYCWQGWGAAGQPMPLKVLHGLATAIVSAMEPWTPPRALRWAMTRAMGRPLNLRCHAFAAMFVDAALNVFLHRGGLFMRSTHEMQSVVIPPSRQTQQSAELCGLCWAMRLARRLGWQFPVLVSAQMVSLRARTWLQRQNRLLRGIIIGMRQCGLVVGLHWISTEFLSMLWRIRPLCVRCGWRKSGGTMCVSVLEPNLLGSVWL